MPRRFELKDAVLPEEPESAGIGLATLQRMLRAQQEILDRLLDSLGEEHADELGGARPSAGQRDVERIERLLFGESPDTSQIAYDFEGHHLGAIAKGPGADGALRALAGSLGRRLLLVGRKEQTIWAWLGGRGEFDSLEPSLRELTVPAQTSLALGEPAHGIEGWRLTHHQADAALAIALRRPGSFVRYGEVALFAAALQDQLLATSLHALYLAPIEDERDGGETLRETLRSYFAAQCNTSSTAALLGVSRQTVTNRLRAIEGRIGRSLSKCAAELETALAIQEFHQDPAAPGGLAGSRSQIT